MDNNIGSKCEYCHKNIIQTYGSGRFCSAKCARSFSSQKANTPEKRIQKSLILQGRQYFLTEESKKQKIEKYSATMKQKRMKKLARVGRGSNRVTLNITNGELESYRRDHQVCEICGCSEVVKNNGVIRNLAVDHDHKNNQFRGLLCTKCNIQLGWFEKYKTEVLEYLTR